ncbi:hypothetical protein O9929_11255 [Vibrio lentus]|nr:hypothetical protein [Vibrio lentus]
MGERERLWDNYYYQSLGHLLAARILRRIGSDFADVGTILLLALELMSVMMAIV